MLIQAALQTQEHAVIPLAQRIDGLLVDQDSIDNSAHHDDLLPVPTVPGEAPDLARGHSADLSKAGFCRRSNPARVTAPAAERPRSSSTVSICDHPSAIGRSRMAYCRALGGSPPEIPAVAASLLSSRGAGPRTLICRRLTGHGQLRLISREVNAPPIAADCDNSFSSSNGAAFAIAQDLMSRRLPKMDDSLPAQFAKSTNGR